MVYLDNGATTKVSQEFIEDSTMVMRDIWGNPSSPHSAGKKAKDLLEESRAIIAETINTSPENIIFTSGGTESNNLALQSFINYDINVTSKIEHPSVLKPANEYFFNAFKFIKPNNYEGFIEPKDLDTLLRTFVVWKRETAAVSIMFANNEIGTIQDIKSLARITHKHNGIFHTDAVQAFGHVPINVKDLGIDMMSVSGHKFGCAKGCGFLYTNINIYANLLGGNQERGLRAGTENLPYIYAMARQAKRMCDRIDLNRERIMINVDYLLDGITDILKKNKVDAFINGPVDLSRRIPGNLSITIDGINAQSLVSVMDMYGVCISAGSACKSTEPQPSHVLKAIGLTDKEAYETIRINIGPENTKDDIDEFLNAINMALPMLRRANVDV